MTRDIFMYEWKKYKEHYDELENGEYRIHDDAPEQVKQSYKEYCKMMNKVKHFGEDRISLFGSFGSNKTNAGAKKVKRDDDFTRSAEALREVVQKNSVHTESSKGNGENDVIYMINDIDHKMRLAKMVLDDLPEYFGVDECKKEYITKSAKMPFLVAKKDNREIGFLAIKKTMPQAAEVYVMGILKEFHHLGFGSQLMKHAENWCRDNHVLYLQVKTLSEDSDDINYAKTRAFYEACGFCQLEVFRTLWDEQNPCLIMVKKI